MNLLWLIIFAIALAYLAYAWTILWLVVPKPRWTAEASRRRLLRILRPTLCPRLNTQHTKTYAQRQTAN